MVNEKDKTITELINKLKLVINFNLIDIVDYWDADLCAIGLKKGNRLVYISTYGYIHDEKIKYDFDLELINETSEDKIEVVKEGRGVSEIDLAAEIVMFFGIGT
jgi:putative N-acetylmannosamine-6-phosphate epimerase